MYFFTSDEHYGHKNVIKYCNRPFDNAKEMDKTIIDRHNEVVSHNDTVIHGGDFTLKSNPNEYIKQLNGQHVFVRGSHDKWMNRSYHEIWEKTIDGIHVVVCHYPMTIWSRSHYGSWQLFGHVHNGPNQYRNGKQLNIGVDVNNFYPFSFDQIKKSMGDLPDNINLVK